MAAESLRQRVEGLEAEVARLRAKVDGMVRDETPWWRKVWGAFANEPACEEAMRYGSEYRESLRPKPRKKRKP